MCRTSTNWNKFAPESVFVININVWSLSMTTTTLSRISTTNYSLHLLFSFPLNCSILLALVQVVVGMPAVWKNGGVSCSVCSSTFENPIRRELKQSDIARECEIAQEHFLLNMSGMYLCTFTRYVGLLHMLRP
jgi:hypothetical protein